jgi:transcriptional regulator with XRE-family HTH domain
VESHLDKKLALQIRSFRGDSSQEEMAKRTGIKQQVISRLENPYYGKATLTTLKNFASAMDVGLLVEFVPFSQLIDRASGTHYVERGYSPETMNVPGFEDENKRGVFDLSSLKPSIPTQAQFPKPELFLAQFHVPLNVKSEWWNLVDTEPQFNNKEITPLWDLPAKERIAPLRNYIRTGGPGPQEETDDLLFVPLRGMGGLNPQDQSSKLHA